jgi:hypothetical protein
LDGIELKIPFFGFSLEVEGEKELFKFSSECISASFLLELGKSF